MAEQAVAGSGGAPGGVLATPGLRHHRFTAAGGPMSVYEAGEPGRPVVVLLHGAMYDEARFVWDQLFGELAARYHVYAIDSPRHGGSRPWPGRLGSARLVGVLEATFAHLGITECHLVGLSMGGGLSIQYAARHPDAVASMVLFEPGGLATRVDHQALIWLYLQTPGTRRLVGRWYARKGRASLARTLASLYVGGSAPTDPERLVGILGDEIAAKARCGESDLDDWQTELLADGPLRPARTVLPLVAALRCPTLWLRGADSVLVKQQEMERAVALAGPDADLRVIPGAGHLLPLERPAEANAAVLAFLERTADA